MSSLKCCTGCGELKPLTEYHKNSYAQSGYQTRCKQCRKVYKRGAEAKERNALWTREYYKRNRDEILRKTRERGKSQAKREYYKKYYNKRYKIPRVKVEYNLRDRLRRALRGGAKTKPTLDLLGCTGEEAYNYIVSKFTPDMTEEAFMNGEIHIDHIKPCASFDLTDPKQQKECFHYTNLQPLWAEDNLSKGAKIIN